VFTAEMRDEAYEERLRRLNKVKGLEAGEEKDETRARRVAFRGFVPRKGPLGNLKLGIPRYQKPGILYLYMCPQRAAQHTTTQHMAQTACVCGGRGVHHIPLITRHVLYWDLCLGTTRRAVNIMGKRTKTEEECCQNDRKKK